jgi:hypothetical protein
MFTAEWIWNYACWCKKYDWIKKFIHCIFEPFTPLSSEDYTELIQPYRSYIELDAPFIEKQIPLSHFIHTLIKVLTTVVWGRLKHFMIKWGLYQCSITLSIGTMKRLHIVIFTLHWVYETSVIVDYIRWLT